MSLELELGHAHQVQFLPGFLGHFPSQHYSGYLSVGSKRLFYYFVASERSPGSDPVVLWLNGGPGCSSFDGFVYEHGPFTFKLTPDNTVNLTLNPWSWSKVASVLYLDSPAGVGLSYSEVSSDYSTNDTTTARDSYAFLQQFFQLFEEFATLPFYITGESFAGVYIPTLAREVVEGNVAGNLPEMNLKGYAIGNGVTDEQFDGDAIIPFAYFKSLISERQFSALAPRAGRMRTWHDLLGPELGDTPPCLDHRELNAWLDQAEVRRALHAAPEQATGRFQECTNLLDYAHDQPSMLANHRFLLSQGLRVLIYNGDHDLCVPHTGAEAWTRSLGLPPIGAWRPWLVGGQVAGYAQAYKGLTYATVLGAGHFVPECKPAEALHMITSFLADVPL
ncbi:hypothetical protein WJX81_002116 [Elliptochloris bilobata]|uniref:Carboxypeptidase n=1 Tax=Elliptochloris bilobata TaxID=381761 RepID=A0AAW1SJL5_9CHLO